MVHRSWGLMGFAGFSMRDDSYVNTIIKKICVRYMRFCLFFVVVFCVFCLLLFLFCCCCFFFAFFFVCLFSFTQVRAQHTIVPSLHCLLFID